MASGIAGGSVNAGAGALGGAERGRLPDALMLERLVMRHVSVGLLVTTSDRRVVSANPALCQLVGAGASPDDGDHLGAVQAAGLPLGPGAGTGTGTDTGRRLAPWRSPVGRQCWLDVRWAPLEAEDADVVSAEVVSAEVDDLILYEIVDVTEVRRREEAARAREVRLSRVQALARIGTWEWDVTGGDVTWSEELLSLFGLPSDASLDYEEYRSLLHPDDVRMIEDTLAEALRTGQKFSYTHRMFLGDRCTERVFECFGEVVTDSAGQPVTVLGTANDITEHRRVRDELTRLAERDPLTGLPNRRTVLATLRGQLDADGGGRGALLLLDVDNFKHINDTGGHAVGDQVLRRVAQLLRETAVPEATVGRLGGDEFAVILPDVGPQEAVAAADDLCAAVARSPVPVGGRAVQVTVSVGVSVMAPDHVVKDLLISADAALYEAKSAGRNRSRLFAPDRHQQPARRLSVLDRVQAALAAGSLVLHAQPILQLSSGAVTAHELLLRLEDGGQPDAGPTEFLPELERTEFALQLDRWVVEQAVAALDASSVHNPTLRLEVNVSGRTLEDPGFGDYVLTTLRARMVNPARLGLEITETAALTSPDAARDLAERVTAAGCRFNLDDFGAGYGSLVHLARLPCSSVKIAGELVQQVDNNEAGGVLVDAVVRVARGLGMMTVAAHVDREPLVPVLRRLGVDCAQGHHLGQPRPLAQLL